MPEREIESEPTPDEALAALRQLAGVFLMGGGVRPNARATALESKPDLRRRPATVVVSADGMIRGLDQEAEQLLGEASNHLVGSPLAALVGKLPPSAEAVLTAMRRKDGTSHSLWVMRSDVLLGDDLCTVLTLTEHDPAGSVRTELRYRHLVEQIPAVVFTAALDGGLFDIYVSPQIETLLHYTQEEWVADPVLWYERLHPDDRPKLDAEFARGCATGGPFKADCRFLTRDNEIVWVHGEARLIKDEHGLPVLVQGVAFDITDTKRAEDLVRASLREKETLLKEIHHRVKNNLQVTSSLLKLQADRIDDRFAKKALRESQGRIRSMALVHELLYRSKNLSNVDLGEYIRTLTRQLLRSHAAESTIRIISKLAPLPLPIDLAVPCGLILNELVSNALKHAFPDGRRGTINIELKANERWNELVVRDDGIGMPAAADFRTASTLGLKLVQTLAEQIAGQLDLSVNGGTEVRLRIPRARDE